MNIFKAYDIRGKYPDELDDNKVYSIGCAAAEYYNEKTIVIGYDVRLSNKKIYNTFTQALADNGVSIINLGIVDTPAVYFAVYELNLNAGIMITASHNPGEYNGFKFCKEKGIPISYKTGINKIEELFYNKTYNRLNKTKQITNIDISDKYFKYLNSQISCIKEFRIAVDACNGVAGGMVEKLLSCYPIKIEKLFFEQDGNFPNHDPNPLKAKNLKILQNTVLEKECDFGVAFDGDADRAVFVDNKGDIIPCDIITIIIAIEYLKKYPGAKLLYDLRSTRAVKEEIIKNGGIPVISRVGHAYIKETMRNNDIIFGGELSGHYYYKELNYCDNGYMTLLKVMEILSNNRQKLNEIIKPFQKYYCSGEINTIVKKPEQVLQKLEKLYKKYENNNIDGLYVEDKDWWFNLRMSNTEPIIRLNCEANTLAKMEELRDKVLSEVKSYE